MPAMRIDMAAFAYQPLKGASPKSALVAAPFKPDFDSAVLDSLDTKIVVYPSTPSERETYRTDSGKAITSYHWDVYDFVRSIPNGRVTTYKDVCAAVGGSPRSVGNALRNNPFAPYIPCHRVIASNFFVGGFFGEWGPNHKTGISYVQKLGLLAREGVDFNEKGRLIDSESVIWRG